MQKVLAMMLFAAAGLAAEPVTLTVHLKGLKSDKGAVHVALFDLPSAFPTKPEKAVAKRRASITSGSATVEFQDLEPGTYAVSAYHDANNNGKMDTNFIGIPKEATGASNDARARMGPPSFKDAQFSLSSSRTITITIR